MYFERASTFWWHEVCAADVDGLAHLPLVLERFEAWLARSRLLEWCTGDGTVRFAQLGAPLLSPAPLLVHHPMVATHTYM